MTVERLKPTHKPIKEYYAALAAIQKTGAKHETALRTAFQHLMEKLARQRGWTFVPERAVVSEGHRVVPDGTLLYDHASGSAGLSRTMVGLERGID